MEDTWRYLVQQTSWIQNKGLFYNDHLPIELQPHLVDLLYSVPLAAVLTVARYAVTKWVYIPLTKILLPASCQTSATITKFQESAFKFTAYLFLTLHAAVLHFQEGWITDTSRYWRVWPHGLQIRGLYELYVLELALYVHLIFAQFYETRRKDFWEMFVHHIVVILLIVPCYMFEFTYPACTVMLLHDICDIFLESAKLANYCQKKALCDSLFVIFAVVFFCARLVFFPFYLMPSITIEALDYVFAPIGWYYFSIFLSVLIILHLMWFKTIMKMAIKFLSGTLVKDDRSDDEDEDDEDVQKKRK